MTIKQQLKKEIKKSRKYGYEVKALWLFEGTLWILASKTLTKSKVKKLKKQFKAKQAELLLIDNFFKKIMECDTKLLVSIRDSKTIYDALDVVKVVEKNIRKGLMIGTKEALLRKFMLIRESLKEIEKLKIEVFDNIYMATLEAAQAALVLKGRVILVPKAVPELLRHAFLGRGLEKSQLNYCNEIIQLYKAYEHKKKPLPNGKKLDELALKSELFRNAVKKLN